MPFTNPCLVDRLQDGLQLFEALPGYDREDEDERMALGDGEPLHRRKLMRAGRVCDLQGADRVVGRYHLEKDNTPTNLAFYTFFSLPFYTCPQWWGCMNL